MDPRYSLRLAKLRSVQNDLTRLLLVEDPAALESLSAGGFIASKSLHDTRTIVRRMLGLLDRALPLVRDEAPDAGEAVYRAALSCLDRRGLWVHRDCADALSSAADALVDISFELFPRA